MCGALQEQDLDLVSDVSFDDAIAKQQTDRLTLIRLHTRWRETRRLSREFPCINASESGLDLFLIKLGSKGSEDWSHDETSEYISLSNLW